MADILLFPPRYGFAFPLGFSQRHNLILFIMCQRERGASREMNGQKARGWAHALMHTDARKLRGQDLILRRSRLCAVKCCRRCLFSIFNYLYFSLPFSSSLKHAVKKALRVSSLLIWDRLGKTCLSSRLPLLLALAPIFNSQARISHLPTPPPCSPLFRIPDPRI